MTEEEEMKRMLLWFKETLPEHDLQAWQIVTRPLGPRRLVEGDPRREFMMPDSDARILVEGYATCARCSQQFGIPNIGNAVANEETRVPPVVEAMKEWVKRDAQRAGPCWGDVPKLVEHDYAVVY